MSAAVDAIRDRPWGERPHRWSYERIERDPRMPFQVPGMDLPLKSLNDYQRRLQTQAFYWLGATSAADGLHRWLGEPGCPLPVPPWWDTRAAVSGAGASSAFDKFADEPTRQRKAIDKAWRRMVDDPSGPFRFVSELGS